MAKILVTGAGGFLGTHLVKKLANLGHEISVLVRTPPKGELAELNPTVFIGDITNLASLAPACLNQDAIFHLAGLISYDPRDREKLFQINTQGTENLLNTALTSSCKHFIFMSSVVAIGAGFTDQDILTEDTEYNLQGLNFDYFESKKRAEDLLRKSAKTQQKLKIVIVNPSTIYGPGDMDKSSRGTQLKAATGKLFFYPPGGVSIVHVDDVIDGTIQAYEKGRHGERYILSGENLHLGDVFKRISRIGGVSEPKIELPTSVFYVLAYVDKTLSLFGRKSFLPSTRALIATYFHWFDCSKAKRELNFNPRSAQVALEASVRDFLKRQGKSP